MFSGWGPIKLPADVGYDAGGDDKTSVVFALDGAIFTCELPAGYTHLAKNGNRVFAFGPGLPTVDVTPDALKQIPSESPNDKAQSQ